MSNNAAERDIRARGHGAEELDFAGSDEGGHRAPAIYTLSRRTSLTRSIRSLARRFASPLARSSRRTHPRPTTLKLALPELHRSSRWSEPPAGPARASEPRGLRRTRSCRAALVVCSRSLSMPREGLDLPQKRRRVSNLEQRTARPEMTRPPIRAVSPLNRV